MSSTAVQPPAVGDVGAGHVLGRYELLLPIASGGMAMVWAARLKGTRGFQKIVAVKTMLPKLSDDPAFEQMFLDEASHASQVRHPHVVEIMDLGEQDGVLYLVMEWINGVPLGQVIKSARASGGVPLPIAVRIATQACAGLHAAHELKDQQGALVGLVHRDVSPQNLLVTYDGVTKVVDFGVAKATARGGSDTLAGHLKGKVGFMAPEQIKGYAIDRRADVFAMGIVMFAMTTGRHPFRKESEAATLYEICAHKPAPSPRSVIPGFPLPLERVIMQALAKDPARRFPTANDLLVAFDRALPANVRLSSDQEVAKYVNGLFADKRDRQKTELQAALERADERAKSATQPRPLRDYLHDSQPPSRLSLSGVSGVTGISEISTDGSGVKAASGRGEVTAPGSSVPALAAPAPATADLEPPPQFRSRAPLVIAAVIGVVALSGLVAFLVLGRSDEGTAAKASATPSTPSAAPAVTAPSPSAESPPQPASERPAASGTEPASPEASAAPGGKSRRPGGKWPIAAPASAKDKPPTTKPPTTPGLKVDKVFE